MIEVILLQLEALSKMQFLGITFSAGVAAILLATGSADLFLTTKLYKRFGLSFLQLLAGIERVLLSVPVFGATKYLKFKNIRILLPSIWLVSLVFFTSITMSAVFVISQFIHINAHTALFGGRSFDELSSRVWHAMITNPDASAFLVVCFFVGYIAVVLAISLSRVIPSAFAQAVAFILFYPPFYFLLSIAYVTVLVGLDDFSDRASILVPFVAAHFDTNMDFVKFLLQSAIELPFIPRGGESDDFAVDVIRSSTVEFHIASSIFLYASILLPFFLSLLILRRPIAGFLAQTNYAIFKFHFVLSSLGFATEPFKYVSLAAIFIWSIFFGAFVLVSETVGPLFYIGKHRIELITPSGIRNFYGEISMSTDCDFTGQVWYFGTREQSGQRLGFGEGRVTGSIRDGAVRFSYEPYVFWGTSPIIRDFSGSVENEGNRFSGAIDGNNLALKIVPEIRICS